MNKYTIKAFGVTKDILGGKENSFELKAKTVGELRAELNTRFPKLMGLRSLYIAVNNDYAEESKLLAETDEIALIPPVSGG
ncbi:MAG TPA: MoaD/ThiS family protein [Chryseolinea sp.]|nr:MoaD/ThiS family protein [Chryseolinea sp.]HPM32061.1 MoaD/ThiS family protein [Chryseolinea sp.]